jgi:hypothetical protein
LGSQSNNFGENSKSAGLPKSLAAIRPISRESEKYIEWIIEKISTQDNKIEINKI